MTRAEVAGLTLALHVLRRSALVSYRESGDARGFVDEDVWSDAIEVLVACHGMTAYTIAHHVAAVRRHEAAPRIVRARLALYLRAVLRAERGERGRWWLVSWPDVPEREQSAGQTWVEVPPHWPALWATCRQARPLWLDAKEHR